MICPNQRTDQAVLEAIFDAVPIYPTDTLVDVGCGDGWVIQHWLNMGLTNDLIGIELDWETAYLAMIRFRKLSNISIIYDDASRGLPKGTLFYLFNPFRGEPMIAFEKLARQQSPRIIYNATHDLDIFQDWNIEPIQGAFRAALLTRKEP